MPKLAMMLCVMSMSLTAQWQNHPTPGIPRTPDGKANLSAPVPRSGDGKPDLSGVWQVRQSSYLVYVTSDLKPDEVRPWAAALSSDFHRRPDPAGRSQSNLDGILDWTLGRRHSGSHYRGF